MSKREEGLFAEKYYRGDLLKVSLSISDYAGSYENPRQSASAFLTAAQMDKLAAWWLNGGESELWLPQEE